MNNSITGKMSLSNILNIILVIAILVLGNMYFTEKGLRIEQENLVEAGYSELSKWKNAAGENMAKIQVLETQNAKTFLAFQSQDSTIKELQALVKENRRLFKKNQGTAAVVKTETKIDTTAVTTVTKDSTTGDNIYTSMFKSPWYDIKTTAKADSTNIDVTTYHTLSLVIGKEKQGLFKQAKTFAIAKDDNPYSNIKDMKVYNISQDNKRFIVGPNVGAGLSLSQGVVRASWQIGFGVTYKLLEF